MEYVRSLYEKESIPHKLVTYIEDFSKSLNWCHLIICRSGAGTIAENLIAGKPALMIPLLTSSDNHQMKNSKYLQNNNAAIIINQKNFTKDYLASLIISFIDNPKIKEALSENILKLNKKDISKNICMEIMNELGVE